jgi:type IX secretion system PorP/SprF family membrane protein
MMKLLTKYFFVLLTLFLAQLTKGQSSQLYNQFIINKYSISPAYAGYTSNNELFLTTGQEWSGIEGAPKESSISFNGPLMGKSSYGAFLTQNNQGIFNFLSTGLGYSYNISINEISHIYLGMSFQYCQNSLTINYNNPSIVSDPRIFQFQNFNQTFMNSSFGILFAKRNLNIGMVLPNLNSFFSKNAEMTANGDIFRIHLSYLKSLNQNFQIETFSMVENYANQSSYVYDFAASLKFNQMFWFGANFRNPSIYGFQIGVNPVKNLLVNYSFETSYNGLIHSSSGSHEISLGILFGNNKDKKYHSSGFGNRNINPYDEWIK